MTRFAIDAGTALRIIRERVDIGENHSFVAPSSLRADVMADLYRDVREGRLSQADGRQLLEGIAELKVRLLGDRVSRVTAWKIATERGDNDLTLAEYLAVATLQADVLVASDPRLRDAAVGVIELAEFDDLTR